MLGRLKPKPLEAPFFLVGHRLGFAVAFAGRPLLLKMPTLPGASAPPTTVFVSTLLFERLEVKLIEESLAKGCHAQRIDSGFVL